MIIREETISDILKRYPYLSRYSDKEILEWNEEQRDMLNYFWSRDKEELKKRSVFKSQRGNI